MLGGDPYTNQYPTLHTTRKDAEAHEGSAKAKKRIERCVLLLTVPGAEKTKAIVKDAFQATLIEQSQAHKSNCLIKGGLSTITILEHASRSRKMVNTLYLPRNLPLRKCREPSVSQS